MHKCTIYSISRLVHHFLISAGSGPTRYHNALSNEIGSDRTSYYSDGPMHLVFVENLNLSQVKGLSTQMYTIHYVIEEKYPLLMRCWGVYAILLHC